MTAARVGLRGRDLGHVMAEPVAYLSAVAALVGTFVGGITSIATSWLGQQRQTKEQRRAREKEELQIRMAGSMTSASRRIR